MGTWAYASGLEVSGIDKLGAELLSADMAQTEACPQVEPTAPQDSGHEPLQSVPMPGAINTVADEYYGALSLDGRHMILTRRAEGCSRLWVGRIFPVVHERERRVVSTGPPSRATQTERGCPTWTGDGMTMISPRVQAHEMATDAAGGRGRASVRDERTRRKENGAWAKFGRPQQRGKANLP